MNREGSSQRARRTQMTRPSAAMSMRRSDGGSPLSVDIVVIYGSDSPTAPGGSLVAQLERVNGVSDRRARSARRPEHVEKLSVDGFSSGSAGDCLALERESVGCSEVLVAAIALRRCLERSVPPNR